MKKTKVLSTFGKILITFVICLIILIIIFLFNREGHTLRGIFAFRAPNITWYFYGYSSPDFTSERLAKFEPQRLKVINRVEDTGWVLADINGEEAYVYIRANRRFINRKMGLYEEKECEKPLLFISSGVVEIIKDKNDWLLINYNDSEKWLYLNFIPPIDELSDALSRFGNRVSIHYENFANNFVFEHYANREFFSASLPKALYALYLYKLADEGNLDLDTYHTYTSADVNTGSGIIFREYSIGTRFTKRELIRLNLSESDNVATNMIRRINGMSGYREFVASIGGNTNFIGNNIFNGRLTANEAGLYARVIYNYIESDAPNAEEFKKHLLNNQFQFITSDYPIASKTGWTRPHAWHDMAIIYADSPFSLVILSRMHGWEDRYYAYFREITEVFEDFNRKWF